MFCTNCGKRLEPEVRFCPDCGTPLGAQPSPAAPQARSPARAASPVTAMAAPVAAMGRDNKTALLVGAVALVLGLAGGIGYWGWSNKAAGEKAASNPNGDDPAVKSAAEEAAHKLAETRQQQAAAEEAAERAEIAAAHALLDKHIAAEEALALASGKASAGKSSRTANQ